MPKSVRTARIGDVVHRHIARLLYEEFKDPRIGLVTIQSVDVSPDLSNAKVYVTVYEAEKVEESIKILNKAAGFFRAELSRLMHLRIVPKPHFIYAESVIKASRLVSLLEEISETLPKEKPDTKEAAKKTPASDPDA